MERFVDCVLTIKNRLIWLIFFYFIDAVHLTSFGGSEVTSFLYKDNSLRNFDQIKVTYFSAFSSLYNPYYFEQLHHFKYINKIYHKASAPFAIVLSMQAGL